MKSKLVWSKYTDGLKTDVDTNRGNVKLTVTLPNGDAMSVQVTKLELDRLGISLGDRVMVDVTSAKVFVDDYRI